MRFVSTIVTMNAAKLDHRKLLLSLKGIAEGLLGHQVQNVWSIYGGLNRLHWAVLQILQNGCKFINSKGEPNYLVLVNGSPLVKEKLTESQKKNSPDNEEVMLWIYQWLEEHSLSMKLEALLSDSLHLEKCYHDYAFLRRKDFASAMILCLRAVEQNQPLLLTEVDPCLYVMDLNYSKFQRHHKRCASLPEDNSDFFMIRLTKNIPFVEKDVELPVFSSSPNTGIGHVVTGINVINGSIPKNEESNWISKIGKRSSSLPDLIVCDRENGKARTKSFSKLSPSVIGVNYGGSDSARKKENEKFIDESAPDGKRGRCRKKRVDRLKEKEWFVVQGKKEERKKTFMEDGGTSVLPMSTGYFPRPVQGQSLTSFLTSEQFSRTNAELDRENAHFSISEAMISAIEQIKCNRELRLIEDVNEEESDEEINRLKQRIRLRRRHRLRERTLKHQFWSSSLLSDGRTDTTATDQSVSPMSSSPDTSRSDSVSTDDDVDDLEVDEASNLKEFKNSELSVSMASLYSEADLSKNRRDNNEPNASAECVALSLLRQFKEKQLPRASDLKWLVSEEDTPQELLPLPKNWPVSNDDGECLKGTFLRGTSDWAPPRAQVIFTLHPPPARKELLKKQNFKCAGCGLRVAQEYAHKFRYCEYLARYFCTGCHSNQLAFIPGRILFKWDFRRYQVSTFSYRLLDQMSTDPLFRISDLNPELYRRVKPLDRVRQLRFQLHYAKDFVFACRFAVQVRGDLQREPPHMLSEPDLYSLQDLIQVKTGELRDRLGDLVKDSLAHVDSCQLCQARGFLCELCPSKEVIFPWLTSKVSRCSSCGSCFHLRCFKSGFCPRCARVSARRLSRLESEA